MSLKAATVFGCVNSTLKAIFKVRAVFVSRRAHVHLHFLRMMEDNFILWRDHVAIQAFALLWSFAGLVKMSLLYILLYSFTWVYDNFLPAISNSKISRGFILPHFNNFFQLCGVLILYYTKNVNNYTFFVENTSIDVTSQAILVYYISICSCLLGIVSGHGWFKFSPNGNFLWPLSE